MGYDPGGSAFFGCVTSRRGGRALRLGRFTAGSGDAWSGGAMIGSLDGKDGLGGARGGGGVAEQRAQRNAGGGFGQQIGDGRIAKRLLDHGHGVVQAFMQRAQSRSVRRQAQWADSDSGQRGDGLDHVIDAELFGVFCQHRTAAQAALRAHDASPCQVLENFGQIS